MPVKTNLALFLLVQLINDKLGNNIDRRLGKGLVMLRIAICDDDAYFRKKTISIIQDKVNKSASLCEFMEYSSGEEFLADMKTVKKCDLLVLDILMAGINGMDVARQIRANNSNACILFISSHIKFSPEGYSVKAVGYILKDDFFERNISATLEMVIPNLIKRNNEILVKTSSGDMRLIVSKIMCVESNNHYVNFYLSREKSYSVREKFSNVAQEMLPYDFILIHRGCIVNLNYIKEIKKTYLVLDPDWEINISRDLYQNVKKKFRMYKDFSI